MTDQTIPVDKVREIIARHRDGASHRGGMILNDLKALLPLPTLADMTEEERAACIRMQCDTAPNRSVRGFIADIYPGGCRVIERDTWEWRSCSDDMVTPRPDLPRMEWPGEAPVPPNTLAVGSAWDDADALARACEESGRDQIVVLDHAGNAYVWDEMAEWWEGSAPPLFAPYTIIHAGKKAHQ